MIEGVTITPLNQFVDERGKVMLMLKSTDSHFKQFGEIYFSCVFPDAVKAWHFHDNMVLNYAVPFGRIKFVLFDDRPESPTRGEVHELFLGEENYSLVTVPKKVWNGFKGVGTQMAVVANCASIPHDPTEIHRRDPSDPYFPYNWQLVHR